MWLRTSIRKCPRENRKTNMARESRKGRLRQVARVFAPGRGIKWKEFVYGAQVFQRRRSSCNAAHWIQEQACSVAPSITSN
jgi:hypothetical protein